MMESKEVVHRGYTFVLKGLVNDPIFEIVDYFNEKMLKLFLGLFFGVHLVLCIRVKRLCERFYGTARYQLLCLICGNRLLLGKRRLL